MDYMMDVEERALFEDKKISAMNGSIAVAQLAVGMAYLDRLGGVEPNPDEAKKWLRKAAASGLVPAKEMLEDLENMEKEDD
jgi:TPR repeat protein